jgi:hypothetical protein
MRFKFIAITRASHDPNTKACLARKEAERKTSKAALRCLKRHLASEFHKLLALPTDPAEHTPTAFPQRPPTTHPVDTTPVATGPRPMICIT